MREFAPVFFALLLGCAGTRPPTADSSACPLRLNLRIDTTEAAVELSPELTNQTDGEMRFTLPNPCPVGPAGFSGLGDAFDYYGACLAGGCLHNDPIEFMLAPGETRALPPASIPLRDDPCNAPEPGTYPVSFTLTPLAGSELPASCGPLPVDVVIP